VLGFGREAADPVEALAGTEGRCRWVAGLPPSWFRCASSGAGWTAAAATAAGTGLLPAACVSGRLFGVLW